MTTERLHLLTRRDCHLCQLARQALAELSDTCDLAISEFDVDEDPSLLRQFTDRVPVVLFRGQVVAEGRIESGRLRRAIEELGVPDLSRSDDSVTSADRPPNRS